ncbi:sensor histidine kinase [Ruminiclostridium herbifermentans]|uniref:histidine kinase n=1 Tax=Ruminiclostridium herbifermentans TaxID=2488810 RepID=A0A4V6ENW3_9FIRM|nr:sensor histidine kinase [Ruminiclostridium herbifermentans]QNU67034.1 sensor histidine kinase [Ruminiclostridium herbifermentans]
MINYNDRKQIKYPLRLKLFMVAIVIIIPMIILSVYQITALYNYSTSYDAIVRRITSANNYNLNFKEEMDESMYKIVVESETFESIEINSDLKNPYKLIEDARENFTNLKKITSSRESLDWIKRILLNLDTLNDRINEIRDNLNQKGHYEENIQMLESDIYILTEMFQEEIQYYLYYETQNFEEIRQNLNEQVTNAIWIMIVALSFIIVASILVNIFVTESITKPIRTLCDKTAMVAGGDFTTRTTCDNHDELSILSDSFNDMASKLEQQVKSIKLEQENLRHMESKLLQTQINPHFLYNTLDTIIWLIEGDKNKEAIDMVVSLSEFFRIVVSKGKDFITVREEETHIKSYLQIQQSRYKDILDYEINIPEELYGYQILKLTMQPIIENSLYHGIKMLRAIGKITVTGEILDGIIYFHVIDNGIGMDEQKLSALRKEIERPGSKQSSGFGLANVNKRIKLNYGNNYGLTIQSTKGKGTDITIKIPARIAEVERIEVGYE